MGADKLAEERKAEERMKLRFYNARILTMARGMELTEGELWVQGNRILYAGDGLDKPAGDFFWDREIDAQRNLLMPGFKNAHTHSAMTFLRSYADDLPLQEWLFQKVFPMEATLTEAETYELCRLAIMEYLTSGITANFDMYFMPAEVIAKASRDCGFRTVLCGAVNDSVQSVEDMRRWYHTLNQKDDLISYKIGFHAEYTTKKPLLEQIAKLAHEVGSPVWCHNSETRKEVEECIGRYGMTPTKLMDSLGMFEAPGGGYHCVHMTEEDLKIFRDRGLTAVTNPASNMKLASGIAPVQKMLDMGIPVAIGTDGPASNNCLDMFREMFLVTGLAKLREENAAAVDADQVLLMATVNGARAMGLNDCDTLEPGKLADLIMIDLKQPNMQPLNHITKNLVYSGSKQNVKLTMVDGRILYEDGTFHIGEDPAVIYENVNRIMKGKV